MQTVIRSLGAGSLEENVRTIVGTEVVSRISGKYIGMGVD
jgi:hypothetical protein